tara:strand:+ start:5085 stop:5489 length:405 start_codon:yes stop_codon:yes gene_type:complete
MVEKSQGCTRSELTKGVIPTPRSAANLERSGKFVRQQRFVRRENAPPANHTVTPKSAPTPAVKPIAKAPQNVTREAALRTGAPPTFAANEPSKARNTNELPGTIHISNHSGNNRTTHRGRAAPTENVPADANAA